MTRVPTVALAVLLVVAGATAPAVAQDGQADERREDVAPADLVAAYNANADRVPGVVRERVAGEQVELVVYDADGAASYYHGTVGEDGRITDYATGRADDPSVRVTTDEATLARIQTAEVPAAAAAAAYESGDIAVDGVGPVDAVQVTAAAAAVEAGRALGLL